MVPILIPGQGRSPTIVENWFSGSEPTIDQAKKLTTGGNWFYPDVFLSLFPIITSDVLYYETAHSTLEHVKPGRSVRWH
jgi:hypothetical protein